MWSLLELINFLYQVSQHCPLSPHPLCQVSHTCIYVQRTAGQRRGCGMVEKQAGTCRQSARGLVKDGHKHYEAGVRMGLEQEGLFIDLQDVLDIGLSVVKSRSVGSVILSSAFMRCSPSLHMGRPLGGRTSKCQQCWALNSPFLCLEGYCLFGFFFFLILW